MDFDNNRLNWDQVADRFDDYYLEMYPPEALLELRKDSDHYSDQVEHWADHRYERDHDGDDFWTEY